MALSTAIAIYFLIWWIVLFAVLPFGVRAVENPEPGHATGAPEKPQLLLKFGITTLVAGVVFAGLYWLIQSDLISFRN